MTNLCLVRRRYQLSPVCGGVFYAYLTFLIVSYFPPTVVVPPGVSPGQDLTVKSPDGRLTVAATVPQGLRTGDTFVVRIPRPPQRPEGLRSAEKNAVYSVPINHVAGERVDASVERVNATTEESIIDEEDDEEEEEEDETREPEIEVQQSRSFIDVLEDMITPTPDPPVSLKRSPMRMDEDALSDEHTRKKEPKRKEKTVAEKDERHRREKSRYGRKMDIKERKLAIQERKSAYEEKKKAREQRVLEVQVPPGMPAGSTIHVEIPGENRTLAAKVPPNTSVFHVAYKPQAGTHEATQPVSSQKQVFPQNSPPHVSSLLVNERSAQPGQKLLLVRVPPGTVAGATLHVSVPDEPGRILAAQVPEGNVREFHVSYQSRPSKHQAPSPIAQPARSMLPPANPYAQGNGMYVPPPGYYPDPYAGGRNYLHPGTYMMPMMAGHEAFPTVSGYSPSYNNVVMNRSAGASFES